MFSDPFLGYLNNTDSRIFMPLFCIDIVRDIDIVREPTFLDHIK